MRCLLCSILILLPFGKLGSCWGSCSQELICSMMKVCTRQNFPLIFWSFSRHLFVEQLWALLRKLGGTHGNAPQPSHLSSCCAALALALAILVPNIEYIFGLCGATVSVLISFILPAALYLRATSMQQGAGMRLAGPFSGVRDGQL